MKKENKPTNTPLRVGVVFGNDIVSLKIPALSYLIVQLNKQQSSFEFEILPTLRETPLLLLLDGKSDVSRIEAINSVHDFYETYKAYIKAGNESYRLGEPACEHIMIVSLAQFNDHYYSWTGEQVGIIALGEWEKRMAPPSLLEIITTLLLSESTMFLNRSYRQLYHLGTKGCVFDFNSSIDDVRLKVLQGFVCSHCRKILSEGGQANLADELTEILSKKWLGNLADNSSPATTIAKLGYNMFFTKGLKPSFWEVLQGTLQQDIPKQIIDMIGAILLAAILLYLGLKK